MLYRLKTTPLQRLAKLILQRWALLIGLLLPAVTAHAQTPTTAALRCPPPLAAAADDSRPQDRGLLWRLEKDGRSAYLYGTVHLGRPHWQSPGPRLLQALQASDTVALEIDAEDPATREALQRLSLAPANSQPPLDLQARLRRHAELACLPANALAALHPLLQAMTLSLLQARWDGLDASLAQEALLSRWARTQGRPIVALETASDQLALLLPAEPALQLQMTRQMLDQLEQDGSRAALLRLVAAWERGDLQELQTYEDWCACIDSEADRSYLRRLNDGRNPALAARIEALHASGARLFVAVGALHMTGPMALPLLLAERGFRVERITWQP